MKGDIPTHFPPSLCLCLSLSVLEGYTRGALMCVATSKEKCSVFLAPPQHPPSSFSLAVFFICFSLCHFFPCPTFHHLSSLFHAAALCWSLIMIIMFPPPHPLLLFKEGIF